MLDLGPIKVLAAGLRATGVPSDVLEALVTEVEDLRRAVVAMNKANDQLNNENERLNFILEFDGPARQQIQELSAENERLKAELAQEREVSDGQARAIASLQERGDRLECEARGARAEAKHWRLVAVTDRAQAIGVAVQPWRTELARQACAVAYLAGIIAVVCGEQAAREVMAQARTCAAAAVPERQAPEPEAPPEEVAPEPLRCARCLKSIVQIDSCRTTYLPGYFCTAVCAVEAIRADRRKAGST